MKILKNISLALIGIYYALFILRVILPQLVQADASFAVSFLLSIILLFASPLAVLAIILICISLYLSFKKERIKPHGIFVVVLLLLSIVPIWTTLQSIKMGVQLKQQSSQASQIEKAQANLDKKMVGSIVLNSVTGERVKDFQVHDNYMYILSDVDTLSSPTYNSYLNIIDVSNPSTPVNKSRIPLPSDRRAQMLYSDNKIYVFDTKSTFVVDVSNKEDPKIVLSMQTPDNVVPNTFFKDARYLYSVGSTEGTSGNNFVKIFDNSNTARWKDFDLGDNYPRDVYAKDGFLYSFFTKGNSFGVSKLSVIDATNLQNIKEIETIDINIDPHSLAKKIVVSGNYMYLESDVTTYQPRVSTVALITVLDISDVHNIHQVGKLEVEQPPFPGGLDMSVSGRYLLLENKIINISNPQNPVIEKELTSFARPTGSVSGEYYYNLDREQDADKIDVYNLNDVLGQ